jgi:hypothetical protein
VVVTVKFFFWTTAFFLDEILSWTTALTKLPEFFFLGYSFLDFCNSWVILIFSIFFFFIDSI